MGAGFAFVDLFAGIGGLRLAVEPFGGRCVGAVEYDRFAQRTYRANFGSDHPLRGDIRAVAPGDIPPHDVLLAGFPCQPFSLAGVSKKNALGQAHGFACEAQGTLFFALAQVLAHHRPRAFLLKNVKHLVRHDRGRTFAVIRRVLQAELGYAVDWVVTHAAAWVPQRRERVFIAGIRDGPCSLAGLAPPPADGPRLASILHPGDGSERPEPPYTDGPRAAVGAKYGLSDHLWGYLQAYAARHKAAGHGFGFGLVGPGDVARTLSARYHKDGSEILIRRPDARTPRRLTPRECARLMGFDRPGAPPFRIPVSDTQAYRQFGNAVAVPQARHVAACLLPQVRHLSHSAPVPAPRRRPTKPALIARELGL